MTVRSRVATLVAEFLGTAILASVVIYASRSQLGFGLFIALAVGVALAALVLTFGKVSGAHLNPAVTVGLWTLRKVGTWQAVAYIGVQLLGGLAAWQMANYWNGAEINSLAPGEFAWKELAGEAVGTFLLAFFMAAAIYQDLTDGQKAALIGSGIFLGVLVASVVSNAALNPAVALGNQTVSKAYLFGPVIGAVLGFNLYALLFAPASALAPRTSTVVAPRARVVAKKPAARKTAAKRKK